MNVCLCEGISGLKKRLDNEKCEMPGCKFFLQHLNCKKMSSHTSAVSGHDVMAD